MFRITLVELCSVESCAFLPLTRQEAWERQPTNKMAANETEQVDVAKEFNLLPMIFETIQALQKTNDPQEFTKKVFLHLVCF